MTTLQVEIRDDIIKMYGMNELKRFIQEELEYRRFQWLEMHLQTSLGEVNVDWEKEFEQARQAAFEEYMQRRKHNV